MMPLPNLQAPETHSTTLPGNPIELIDIFYTIQGEGPYVGEPAIFIRMAGCNYQCPRCDTDYTTNRKLHTTHEITQIVLDLCRELPFIPMIVITGGEPFRQPFGDMVRELVSAKPFFIQVETNGSLYQDDIPWAAIEIVCSPKGRNINSQLIPYIKYYKYVLAHDTVDQKDGLPTQVLGRVQPIARPHKGFTGKVYVSPEDSGNGIINTMNIQACVYSSMLYGYTLSLQTHKILGVK